MDRYSARGSRWPDGLTLTDDVHRFASAALPTLTRHPVENTLLLTIVESLLSGLAYSSLDPVFGWYDDDAGAVAGGCVMTPPYEIVLADVSPDRVRELVETLCKAGVEVPGVNADSDAAEAFAAAWTAERPCSWTVAKRHRLYQLAQLRERVREVAGRARPAGPDDQHLITGWLTAFAAEVGRPLSTSEAALTARIAGGRVTDLENPTSNSIYQQIGLRPVSDHLVLRF